jgi:predicted enzyme related to lactoylglutathione lyase
MSALTNGIGWFEIGSDDTATVRRFYADVFGWTFADPDAPYSMVTTPAPGSIKGGIASLERGTPGYAVFYVEVADVAQAVKATEAAGGGGVVIPPTKDDTGLVFAQLLDPSGNRFGVYTPAGG